VKKTKVYVVNDTSRYHCGSAAAMHVLYNMLSPLKIVGVHHNGDLTANVSSLKKCDCVVVNGEGSMHHMSKRSAIVLNIIEKAVNYGKSVYLVNTVWQRMDKVKRGLFKKIKYVSVREMASAKEIASKFYIEPHMHLDLSYYMPIGDGEYIDFDGRIVFGGSFIDVVIPEHITKLPRLTLWEHDWATVVRSLRTSSLYITGRHHGVYAACVAGIPFVYIEGNSHKIRGLFEWADVDIPIAYGGNDISRCIGWAKQNGHVYERLFDFMKSRKQPPKRLIK